MFFQMDYENQIANIFSLNGELSQNIKGFRPRAEQLEMAYAVGKAIQNKSSLVVEAGTGTGKNLCISRACFSFLVKKPLFLQDLKIFKISFLIEIFQLLKKALNFTGKIALLKGRANYLCLERLDQVIAQGVLGDKSVLAELK